MVRILNKATRLPERQATDTSRSASVERLEVVTQETVGREAARSKPLSIPTHVKSQDVSLPMKVALFLVSFGLFLGLWEGAALVLRNPVILSEPIPVLAALASLLQNHIPQGAQGLESAYTAIAETLEIIVAGFALSLIGVPIGILMGRWKTKIQGPQHSSCSLPGESLRSRLLRFGLHQLAGLADATIHGCWENT